MAALEVVLKIVATISTRPQTNQRRIEGWLSPAEQWVGLKVDELIASAPADTGAVAFPLPDRLCRIKVSNRGVEPGGERLWEIYPKRTVLVDVDDGTEDLFLAHFDAYFHDLQTELIALLESAPVVHRVTILGWHLHLAAGSVDEVP